MRLKESRVTLRPDLIPQQPLHLLIVEDVMADVELITLTLEAAGVNFTYDTADTALTCQQLLRSQIYDAVLSDYRLPDYNNLPTLKILQESRQEIPLILVTGTLGEEAAVECINAGMTDYVLKQRLFRLPTVLARALQEFELRRQKEAAIAQIQASAWREAMINRLVQSLRGTLDVDEILQRTANQLHEVLQVSCCMICQPEPNCQIRTCYISQTSGEHQNLIAVNCDFSAYYWETLLHGESVVLDRIDFNLTPELQEAAKGFGIRSLMMAPLRYQQSYLGEITLHQCDKEREWTADEMALAIAVAEQCAIAIHQAQLYQQAQTELAERKRLEEVVWYQAEKLEQANRLKDEFLAIISHELRTPLSTILCWSQVLRSKKLTAAMIERAIESIERSAKAQVKIVDDILDVSRIIRDEIRLHNRPIDLIPIIAAVIDDIRPTAEAKELQVESVLEKSVDLIWGDPDRLKQIIGHLLSNAVKFTPAGGRVEVRLSKELKVNRLQVQKAEGGRQKAEGVFHKGIEPLLKESHLNKWGIGSLAPNPSPEALGKGQKVFPSAFCPLPSAFLVESDEPPQNPKSPGSRFYFTIVAPGYSVAMPVREKGDCLKSIGKADRPLPELTQEMRQLTQQIPLRILLAEDNKVNQQVALLTLKQLGYQADVVSNGREVLEALRRQPYDVVLMDVEMPQMDGLTATRLICQEWPDKSMKSEGTRMNEDSSFRLHPSSFKRPRIIAMTAYAMAGDRQKCIEAGMDDYISKPIQEQELIRALQLCQSGAVEPRKQPIQERRRETQNLKKHEVERMKDDKLSTSHLEGDLNSPHVKTTNKNLLLEDSNPRSVPLHTSSYPTLREPLRGTGTATPNTLQTSVESQFVLDPRVLKSLRQMAGAKAACILSQIINNYLEDAPQLLQDIRDAVAAGDAQALRQSAHTLRSSSANLGAMNLSNLCKELEMMGRAGSTTKASEWMAQVEAEYEKVKVALHLENEQISWSTTPPIAKAIDEA